MSAPGWLALAFLGLIVSARTRLTATVAGQPVSVPVLWLAAAVVLLALAVVVLMLIRSIARDRRFLYLRPRMVRT